MKYAIAYVVINKRQVSQAINQGWQLFKENWLVSLEMALILFFINILDPNIFLVRTSLSLSFLIIFLASFTNFSPNSFTTGPRSSPISSKPII